MKPLPDFNDAAAMAHRGKQSALASARNEASALLRDSVAAVQVSSWEELATHADVVSAIGERLKVIAAMWNEL